MNEEDIQQVLKIFPVWDDSVWEPLQKKDFEEAERKLELVFENIDMDDWSSVYWQGIFSGIPAVLGNITLSEWKNMVRPIIIRSLITTASGKGLSIIIQNLGSAEQLEFIGLFTKNVFGATGEEKEEWLKEKRPSIYMLAISAPGQELGMNPIRYPDDLSVITLSKKFRILPKRIRDSLFSYSNAEVIFRSGRNNHLSDEKISLLSRVVGRVLMGFVHMEDFRKEIESELSIDDRIAGVLADELEGKIFYSVSSDISDVYEPINLSLEKEVRNKEKSEISISDFSSGTEESIPITTQASESPFIIHEERSAAPVQDKKSILKSISIPLGFFKKKTDIQVPVKSAKVQIESPTRDEKRVVNYSELRTSISPFENQSFINPIKNPTSVEVSAVTPGQLISNDANPVKTPVSEEKPVILPEKAAPSSETVSKQSEWIAKPVIQEKMAVRPSLVPEKLITEGVGILGTIKKTQPKVEGNLIDLKN